MSAQAGDGRVSSERLELLARKLREQGLTPEAGRGIPRRPDPERPAPLSFAQQRLWFLAQLDPGSAGYNAVSAHRLRGPLDVHALERALREVLRRHETLRTRFPDVGGEPFQVVTPPDQAVLAFERRDVSSGGEEAAREAAAEEARRPFDLAHGPLFRALLLRLGPQDHVLSTGMHHIVSDAWSRGVLNGEIAVLYNAFRAGLLSPLPPLPIQYADFAVWQRQWLQGDVLARQLDYWKQRLAGNIEPLDLPADRPRPAVQTYRGACVPLAFPAGLADALRRVALQRRATLFMALLAAYAAWLHRYSGRDDLVIGVPIAGRNHVETEPLIGLFANTLALRVDVGGDPSFAELLDRTSETALDAYAHPDLPFERLVEELQPERNLGANPLFQVVFTYQNVPRSGMEMHGLEVCRFETGVSTLPFDLTLSLGEQGPDLAGHLEYSTDLFDPSTAERMGTHLATLTQAAARTPEARISALPLLPDAERRRMILHWNATARDYPRGARIEELFEAQATRTPTACAIEGMGRGGPVSWTYAELDARAEHLARRLRHGGVRPGDLVGVCLRRTPDLVASLLAVLKAGAAYVPFDPAYPERRIAYMLSDSTARFLMTEGALASRMPTPGVRLVRVDVECESAPCPTIENDARRGGVGLAYVLYTSGSTGRPKGVAIEHRSAVSLLHWARDTFSPEDRSRVLASSSVCFDLSVFEMFLPLCWGGTVVLAEDVLALPEMPQRDEVTLINTVPSAMTELLRIAPLPRALRVICLAGEPLPGALAERIHAASPTVRLYNLYGPTECTTYATGALVPRGSRRPPPIGRPLPNIRAYVLDPHGQPVPVGVPGELYLGGVGLARGYHRRPDLTAERFVPNPFAAEEAAGGAGQVVSDRLYRTGDRVRFRPDGEIEFLGREDGQVKVRGFRVELGEIESVLAEHPAVERAAVLASETAPGDRRLIAYVSAASTLPDDAELRAFLSERLPAYMVPSAFVPVSEWPFTPSGKTDRRALEAMTLRPKARGGATLRGADETPPSPLERLVAKVWAEALGLADVDGAKTFFDLGGHSLLAVKVVARLREVLEREVPLRLLFEAPTVAGLADALRRGAGAKAEELERLAEVFLRVETLSDEEVARLLDPRRG